MDDDRVIDLALATHDMLLDATMGNIEHTVLPDGRHQWVFTPVTWRIPDPITPPAPLPDADRSR
jgi:hypothetical protein